MGVGLGLGVGVGGGTSFMNRKGRKERGGRRGLVIAELCGGER